MTVSPFDSKMLGTLYSDPEIAPLFSEATAIQTLVDVEVALAKVQGELGIIPRPAAARIREAASSFEPDIHQLAESTGVSGVATTGLVMQLRRAAGDAGTYVHWGATSQDIIDTGLMLRLQKALTVLERRLNTAMDAVAALAESHRQTVMLGRTRSQQAAPTTFGLKAAGWLNGLIDGHEALDDLRPRLLRVQFGGAVGTLAVFGDKGIAVSNALAKELGLAQSPAPWHSNRTSIVDFASRLALITGSLGKIGQDIVLLSQVEVGELHHNSGGGSSTMPQKSNPILGETLITLARANAGLVGTLFQAQIQEHERGGPGWQLEEMTLPQMVLACGAALRLAEKLLTGLIVDKDRMRQNLDEAKGIVLAEAATFALLEHMSRDKAEALVKDAVTEIRRTSQNLITLLKSKTDVPVDWGKIADPGNYLGVSEDLITRTLSRRNY